MNIECTHRIDISTANNWNYHVLRKICIIFVCIFPCICAQSYNIIFPFTVGWRSFFFYLRWIICVYVGCFFALVFLSYTPLCHTWNQLVDCFLNNHDRHRAKPTNPKRASHSPFIQPRHFFPHHPLFSLSIRVRDFYTWDNFFFAALFCDCVFLIHLNYMQLC